jgi:pantetheine-phosphate adenylyltransferase
MTLAVYPGSFDPIHRGHMDVAERAARIFDRLIVAVYATPQKSLMFDRQERTALARRALEHLDNVTVTCYEGMTVDFLRTQDAQVIVRGLRMAYDFDLEYQMALTNCALAPDLETVCLFTKLEYSFFSSSQVKAIATAGGDVSEMVPQHVVSALETKLARPRAGAFDSREGR